MLQKDYFFTQNFFSKALRKFSMRRMTMFNISGRLSKIISLRSKKKSQSYDTPIKRYQGKPGSHRKTKTVRAFFPLYHCREFKSFFVNRPANNQLKVSTSKLSVSTSISYAKAFGRNPSPPNGYCEQKSRGSAPAMIHCRKMKKCSFFQSDTPSRS